MKRYLLFGLTVLAILSFCGVYTFESAAQQNVRAEINIPDIPGYVTLKCDFHMHTVFSDGFVWPSIRPKEIWREGLDAFAITDHIEYLPHKDDVNTDMNRSYEIAARGAKELDLILIKGGEITRKMPPGHLNAIFLNDVNALDEEKYEDAIVNAADQGAFIFWNHPGWKAHQPDGVARWYDDHTALYQKGLLHGIEIVNGRSYYPEAHQWCLEKNLTMIGSSDIHNPIQMDYDFSRGEHRPMTLVFAEDRTVMALEDALRERRTAVYWEDVLIGEEQFLKAIFDAAVSLRNTELIVEGRETAYVHIENLSDLPFHLILEAVSDEIHLPEEITLAANGTVLFSIRKKIKDLKGDRVYTLPFIVKNLWIAPDTGLPAKFSVSVRFI
ncbi:MAG: Sb-PDE family phosphodiesterase [candidate division KSB1 bacterium]|jgi:hypothetical protein|nr:Sb-PDE family phosphodiesterase [candidate division KSB1 bacterium]